MSSNFLKMIQFYIAKLKRLASSFLIKKNILNIFSYITKINHCCKTKTLCENDKTFQRNNIKLNIINWTKNVSHVLCQRHEQLHYAWQKSAHLWEVTCLCSQAWAASAFRFLGKYIPFPVQKEWLRKVTTGTRDGRNCTVLLYLVTLDI